MKKNIKGIITIGALLFSVSFSMLFKWAQTGDPFRAETIMYASIVFFNIIVLGSISRWLFHKYSDKKPAQLKKNVLPAIFLFALAALVISLVVISVGVYVFYLIKGLDTTKYFNQLIYVELPSAIKQFAVWILIGAAFFFYIIWRKAINLEQKLREENLKYKYQNLKSQVNPHFLFNTLNTLSEIVYEDAQKADDYIQKLSKIYRYVLENEEVDLISLVSELEFVKQFFDIQKMRDNGKILLDVDLQGADKIRVVPVSVQILVENALKHNARSIDAPLHIKIDRINDYIVVTNNIIRKNMIGNSPKKGLSNLKERIKLIIKRDVIVKEENDQFIVKIPFIEAISK